MIKLVWLAIIMTSQGPAGGEIPESTTFKTREECQAFGEAMTPRLEDYVRGLTRQDWSNEVRVRFKCEPNGQPV